FSIRLFVVLHPYDWDSGDFWGLGIPRIFEVTGLFFHFGFSLYSTPMTGIRVIFGVWGFCEYLKYQDYFFN
ncbi:MAG TPA: hypothetical protein P5292_05115, partial [Bacteroidia bacterium]|nr:hypothetical protein [Bacteroidia bacterium]